MTTPTPEQANPSVQTRNEEADSKEYDTYAELTGISKKTLMKDTSLEYWTDTIDLSKSPSVIQLQSYAACAIAELREARRTGMRALDAFQEDFHGWELEHFNPLSRAIKRELEQILYDKGIRFVKAETIAQSMYNIVRGTAKITFSHEKEDRVQSPTPAALVRETTPRETTLRETTPRETTPRETRGESKPFQQLPPQEFTSRTPTYDAQPYTIINPEQHDPYDMSTSLRQTPVPMPFRPTPFQLPPVREYMNEKLAPEKIVQFQKAWKKENNYTGRPYDILADKTAIFIELCRRLEIEEPSYAHVFPDILEGRAHMYYLHTIGPGHTWKSLYEHLSRHFNTNVNHNQYWTDWSTMSFARCRQENPDKSLHEVLEVMIDKLTLAQRALGPQFQGELPLYTAVTRACRGQPELEQAMFTTKSTCEALFSDLRASLQIAIDRQPNTYLVDPADSYYTDRRYHSASRTRGFTPRGRSSRGSYRTKPSLSSRPNTAIKKCFVCHKEGCWSSNHPRAERSRATRQYVSSYEGFYDTTPSHEEVHMYIQELEGEPKLEDEEPHEDDLDVNEEDGEEAIHYLTSAAYFHRTTGEDIYNVEPDGYAEQFILEDRYRTTYQGELWDTGAAKVSTVGRSQLEAYVRENPRTKIDWTPSHANISFGGQGSKGSIGTVRINNPVGSVTYHILDTPTPFLLCLADADRLGAYFNNVLNVIVCKDKTTVPVVRKWGHPFFNVGRAEAMSFFTETELRRLHRRFGHPRTERLHSMLTKAGHDVDASVLEEIKKFCHMCQVYDRAPHRFKFTIKDDSHFNYEIIIDVVHINNKDVLHVIDAGTSFQAATFLKSMSARDTWDALCKCWINTYQGPPDYIVHDPGTNFASEDFRNRAKIVGATCKQMPVEAHWAVGKIERAHAPLRRTFNILQTELGDRMDEESILQMAVKALNDTAGPNGLVPTLLVFGTYPRINIDSPPSPDITVRAQAVRKAMKMLQNERAKVDINRAIKTRNGPVSHETLNLPLGSEVMTWREKKGWIGPYEIKSIEGRDIIVEGENGPIKLRCTQVKPYYRANEDGHDDLPQEPDDPDEPTPVQKEAPKPRKRGRPRKEPEVDQPYDPKPVPTRPRGRPRKNPIREQNQVFLSQKEKDDFALALKLRADGVITTPGEPFEESDRKEMDSLIAGGTFEVQSYDPSQHSGRIFNLRLVREVKGKSTQPYEKSRLVFAGHSDTEKEEILTQSPTIQRMSQRLLLAIAPSLIASHGMHCELRDITQAYVQSTDKLTRTLYARPPKEIRDSFPPRTIFKVVRPLYGAAESGLYWFKTYHNHHKEKLKMQISSYDPCLLITREGETTFGMTGLQTDDTLSVVTPEFSGREEEELQKAGFRAKPKTILSHEQPLEFNGGKIKLVRDTIVLTQKGQVKNLRTIDPTADDAAQQYVEQRARGAYIASVCQPEAAFDLSVAAQTTTPSHDDIKALNVRIQWQIDNPDRGLSYVPLQMDRAKLFIFTDGSFANNRDLSSQLGYVIALGTEHSTGTGHDFEIQGNIVHWNSTKCKRVTRSVLASELYGMVGGFDSAIALSTTLQQIVRNLNFSAIPVVICTDSKSLYDCLVKLGTTNEKRLMIDIMSIRESYEKREITEIRWINGKDNPADACTKKTPNKAIEALVSHNRLTVRVEASVDRLDPVQKVSSSHQA